MSKTEARVVPKDSAPQQTAPQENTATQSSSIQSSSIQSSGIPSSGIPSSGIPSSGIPSSGIPSSSAVPQDDLPSPSRVLRNVQREYSDEIRPLLQKSCGQCHWGDGADGDINFEPFDSLDDLLRASSKWKDVVDVIIDGDMPPEDEPQLAEPEKQQLLNWIDQLLNTIDCSTVNPGRVTIRRLNRTEYRNTIRDLVGIDYKTADSFPGDDVGYGFDNIADVLSLPPILMDRYLQAAEEITTRAIRDPAHPPLSQSFSAARMSQAAGSRPNEHGQVLIMNATISREIDFPETGDYRFRFEVSADQAGDEKARLGIRIDGKDKPEVEIKVDRPDFEIVERTYRVRAGKRELGLSFVNDFYNPRKKEDRNLQISRIWIEGPMNVSSSHKNIVFIDPGDDPEQQTDAAEKIISRFASRAFRRPASENEVSRLITLYESARGEGESFEAALRYPLQALLVSPHFLYKIETPTADSSSDVQAATENRNLSSYELATAMSYFLWSTMPDDELYLAAFDDTISGDGDGNRRDYAEQIQRMLADEKSAALVENFFAQWFQLRALPDFQPDPDMFPGIDARMRRFMARETMLLAADVVERDASLLELLTTPYTFVNAPLARHYGMDVEIRGDRFQKVKTQPDRSAGVLTHASILTLTSNPNRTSPVKRGKWIQENLLGEEPTFPDPDIMPLDDQTELKGTLRQRMEQHRTNPSCASCHETMDALGFSLENFDAVGRWRELDDGITVDASGELPDGTAFVGPEGLRTVITEKMKQQFLRCFAEKLLIYATGRGLEYYDECAVDQILEYAQANDYRFSAFVIAVTESDPFKKRR